MKPSSVRRSQSGYSLAELMVVLAIIGVVSLVTVPQFVAYQRSGQLKSSMRQVTNDLRLARQRAVSEHTQTRLRFTNNARTYTVDRQVAGAWTTVLRRTMEQSCTLTTPTDLPSVVEDGVTYYDIVFTAQGLARVTGTNAKGSFRVRTEWALSRNFYTVEVYTPGFVKAV